MRFKRIHGYMAAGMSHQETRAYLLVIDREPEAVQKALRIA